MDSVATASLFRFGRWQVSIERRQLLCDGRPIAVGERAFDILVILLAAHGTVVTKDHLLRHAWPGRMVEENTIEAQISALRRVLGRDKTCIRTLSGRGYQFVGELIQSEASGSRPTSPLTLPVSVTPLIGRDPELQEIIGLVTDNRLVTLVGAGGIGKTRLALEVARHLQSAFTDGVTLAELGPLNAADSIPPAVAQALGFPLSSGTRSLDRIAASIQQRRILLVLDNCEHLIQAAAEITETLLHAGLHLKVLATSREALRAEGEYVYRVPSLEVPREDVSDPAAIMRCGALQLFEARTSSALVDGVANPGLAALKALICRRLDGIPLAIELAAARVRLMGLRSVAEGIEDRFGLLTGGARTALPRHKTLRATLDWSYQLLTLEERLVLGRLSVFSGSFVIESAKAVAASSDLPPAAVKERLLELVEKSLVAVDPANDSHYRLLETTRIYAREKLEASKQLALLSLRHAQHFAEVMRTVETEWNHLPTAKWATLHAPKLEDIRTAIEWAVSQDGAPALGVALTVATLPLWLHLALLEECLSRADVALRVLDAESIVDGRARMKLHAARGACLLYQGVGPNTGAAFKLAMELASDCDDIDYQLRAAWGLWSFTYINGDYAGALSIASRFKGLAAKPKTGTERLIGERMIGMSLFCLGRLAEARLCLEAMLSEYVAPQVRSHLTWFVYEQRMLAQTSLAQALWLLGYTRGAMAVMRRALDDTRALNHAPSLCNVLTECVCPLSLLTGGVEALAEPVEWALEATCRHGISTWKARGRMWLGLWQLARGDANAYAREIRPAIEEIGAAIFVIHYTGFVSAMCQQLGRIGMTIEALRFIERAIDRARAVGDTCSLPELLRVRGVLLALDPERMQQAETQLFEAFELSRQQEAVAWELRCAISLGEVWIQKKNASGARELIRPVLQKFAGELDTVDVRSARRLLE